MSLHGERVVDYTCAPGFECTVRGKVDRPALMCAPCFWWHIQYCCYQAAFHVRYTISDLSSRVSDMMTQPSLTHSPPWARHLRVSPRVLSVRRRHV